MCSSRYIAIFELCTLTISTYSAKDFQTLDWLLATNDEKVRLLKLNRQTPCQPRSAVSVNQGCRISSFTHGIQFAFDNCGDQPSYVGQENVASFSDHQIRKVWICFQKARRGLVRPCSQFLSVPKLTPSRVAKASRVSLALRRYSANIPASECTPLPGGESTLTPLITSWQ